MAKITRVTQKQFGSTGPSTDFGQFGSLAASAATFTKDPATIQSLSAFLTGWASAIIGDDRPALEDMNSLFLLAFRQIAYVLQQGVAEYDAATTYYINSIVQSGGYLYISLTDANLGNAVTNVTYWKPLPFKITNQAAGDIIYFDGTNWVRLAKGTALQQLRMNAGATAPEYATIVDPYVSGWFAVATDGTYTLTHGLGSKNVAFIVYHATDLSGSNMREVGKGERYERGADIKNITTTQVTIQAGHSSTFLGYTSSGLREADAGSGYYNVIGHLIN